MASGRYMAISIIDYTGDSEHAHCEDASSRRDMIGGCRQQLSGDQVGRYSLPRQGSVIRTSGQFRMRTTYINRLQSPESAGVMRRPAAPDTLEHSFCSFIAAPTAITVVQERARIAPVS